MAAVDPRLESLLGRAELALLRQRLRRYFARVGSGAAAGAAAGAAPTTLRLSSLTAAERECLAQLAGRPPRDARSIQLDIAAIDAKLRDAGIAASLRDALEQLDGPLVHHAAERAQARERWAALAAGCSHPALAAWLQDPGALGLLKRLARQQLPQAAQLLEAATAVLQRLPAGGVPLAQLAAETLGDAHGLDSGQPVATLVLAAWRQHGRSSVGMGTVGSGLALRQDVRGVATQDRIGMGSGLALRQAVAGVAMQDLTPVTGDSATAFDESAEQGERARTVWARAGVLVNELARPALVLNLPVLVGALPAGPTGEPAYLSLRQLLRAPPRWDVAGRDVFVCENPSLLAIAADRLGRACAPMVCTDGMPAAAQRTLLGQLAQAGATLHYHGDFDWAGIHIANHVLRTWGARHWRLARQDYEAAVQAAPQARHDLAGSAVAARWDATLTAAMQAHGRAIAEEAVATTLVEDLRRR